MKSNVELILEAFIKNELSATDTRISAIKIFADTLRSELMVYTRDIDSDKIDKTYLAMVLKLFKNMIMTYEEELKLLMNKRQQMLDHLVNVRSLVVHMHANNDSEMHIN